MNKTYTLLIALFVYPVCLLAQTDTVYLSLNHVISMAQDSSLSAFKNKYSYEIQYWEYKNYQAGKKPNLNFSTSPFTYNRSITKQFNPSDTSYSYYNEQNLNSSFNLNLRQNITSTGGNIYVQSDLNRFENFSGNKNILYSAAPLRIGFDQPVFGFNSFKWDKRIEPVKFQKAKMEYVQSAENIAIEVVSIYFGLVWAEQNLKIAITNLANSDTLYQIGMRRQAIFSIDKADLFTLKLDRINAENALKEAHNSYDRAFTNLSIYLGLSKSYYYKVSIPDSLPVENIDAYLATNQVRKVNPFYLSVKQQLLEVDMDVEKKLKDSRFSSNLSMSFGLNQQNNTLSGAYKNPSNQQLVNFSLQIPLVDWGQRKGLYNLAKSRQKLQMVSLKQEEITFEEEVRMTINEFNLQKGLVKSAKEAADVAIEVYEMNKQRFLLGKIDVNTLSYQISRKESAILSYINALQKYWQMFYKVRQLTLFDYNKNISLDADLEKMF